jgi:hypothetical protein
MIGVVLEILTAFHAAAVGETGLATALAALTALASGPVAAILVLVAPAANIPATSRDIGCMTGQDGDQRSAKDRECLPSLPGSRQLVYAAVETIPIHGRPSIRANAVASARNGKSATLALVEASAAVHRGMHSPSMHA